MGNKQDYIAVFDSGVGGISVLRQLRRVLPQEKYLYFGDSANAPYGTRPREEIRNLTLAAAEKLVTQGIKALVIACNTATSAAMEALKEKYPYLIVLGIEPALSIAAENHPGGHIGVLATPATLTGAKFLNGKRQYEKVCRITPIPAPGLMDLVEAGRYNSPEADMLLHTLLDPFAGTLDAVVLGCTHYPFVEAPLRRVLGDKVALIDGAVLTAQQTRQALEKADLLWDGEGEVVFQNSLNDPRMIRLSRQLAGLE